MLDKNLMSKLVEMSSDEVESFADDTFNKYEAVEKFSDLVMRYRLVIKRGGSCPRAEEMAAKIEAGITAKELERWLI